MAGPSRKADERGLEPSTFCTASGAEGHDADDGSTSSVAMKTRRMRAAQLRRHAPRTQARGSWRRRWSTAGDTAKPSAAPRRSWVRRRYRGAGQSRLSASAIAS